MDNAVRDKSSTLLDVVVFTIFISPVLGLVGLAMFEGVRMSYFERKCAAQCYERGGHFVHVGKGAICVKDGLILEDVLR